MTEANQTVLKVLNHMNEKINSVGGVVDSWSDGNGNWWRKYADGFIEQGGFVPTEVQATISFNTAFTSTNYSFLVCTICTRYGEDGAWASRELAGNRTTTSTKCYTDSWGGDNGRHGSWFACGY